MSPQEALDRLCALCGITPEYADIWGKRHRVSRQTKHALLAAMGIAAATEGAARSALEQRETGPWRRLLPPVQVVREADRPAGIAVTVPGAWADRLFTWGLTLEHGEGRQGQFRPRDLAVAEEKTIRDVAFVRYLFPLPLSPGIGYHRFALEGMAEGDRLGAEMTLIVAPATCYQPPVLAGEGRVWGPSVQLYAVRSQRNWGIGDFTDLKAIMELCAGLGAGIVGLNPLHALFPHNPNHISPYSPSSRLFLNVLCLDVEAVPDFAECQAAAEQVRDPGFQARLRALRAEELVDYQAVAAAKLQILDLLYLHFRQHQLPAGERGKAFRAFQAEQGEPLRMQALFETLQEHFHALDPQIWGWPVWPEPFRDPASPQVAAFCAEHPERVEFYQYLQWQAELQLAAAGRRSRQLGLGVGLYQDLAVSVDRGGAEAWANQRLYALGAGIGAPPDDFNLNGQDWGLPPLVPERLRDAAYAPFIATLRHNMRHAGALRIDHVMGLMRLYWVPPGGTPADGTYVSYPLDDLLGILALESQRNRCLVIGEDLGTVPDQVRQALRPLGVLSYRLLYFAREADGAFLRPADYPAQALVAASTHDLPTLRGYWQGHDLDVRRALDLFPSQEVREQQIVARARDRARLLMALEREGLLPPGLSVHPVAVPDMTPELAAAIHVLVARTPAKVMMIQPEDVLGQVEQANLPGTTDQHPNWRRKLPLNLEEWQSDPRVLALAAALGRELGRA